MTTEGARSAWSIPAVEMVPLLPGAARLLEGIQALGLRCWIVSNAFVRTAVEYQADFEAQGLAAWIDGIVSSVDTVWRKPDSRIFAAALEKAGADPARSVMIGNSEPKDVRPARRLGMRSVRVAIEEPLPAESAADIVCESLAAALEAVRQLAADVPAVDTPD